MPQPEAVVAQRSRPQEILCWITVNYREAYGMYACNGIFSIMNHRGAVIHD